MLMLHLILFIIAQLLDFNLDKKKSLRRAQFTYVVLTCTMVCFRVRLHYEEVRIFKKKKTCLQGRQSALYLVHHQLYGV